MAQQLPPAPDPSTLSDEPETTFGVTVVDSSGLKGDIYLLEPYKSPNFKKMKPVGSIYALALNIPPRDFREGFPGITDRYEWFAIDYNGTFWIQNDGSYSFRLSSDDGSKLLIDGKTVVDNNGLHPMATKTGSVSLKPGPHNIRLQYFQGPQYHLGLVLQIARPGDAGFHLFNMRDFLPPAKQ